MHALRLQSICRASAISAAILATGCGTGTGRGVATARPGRASAAVAVAPARRAPGEKTLAAAGDIACPPGQPLSLYACHQAATARLVAQLRPDAVATLGDEQYPSGTHSEFAGSFARTWGRLKAPLHPAPGNHEYETSGARGYFGYFGRRAGSPVRGYYSWNLGAWHMLALNSNCDVVSCAAGSAQVRWLRGDLARNRQRCVLAYWHHPRFSSGPHGDDAAVAPLVSALYRAGADVILSGHDHDYERFAPQDPSGRRDDARGLRQFVVGTGGASHYPFLSARPNSEFRDDGSFGVLLLTLRPRGYAWRFVADRAAGHADTGSAQCH